jgi:GAF domain-containing protein/PAS domain-containing protein
MWPLRSSRRTGSVGHRSGEVSALQLVCGVCKTPVVVEVSERVVRVAGQRGVVAFALAGVAGLGVVYPFLDDRTQNPLALFVLPVLAIAALGSWRETLLVGSVANLVALAEGLWGSLDAPSLAARMVVVVCCGALGVVVAAERGRRDRVIEATDSTMLRVSRAMHAGRLGTWQWDRATGAVEWDDDVHALFGLEPGEFEGTFDGWLARVHPDDRQRVLGDLDQGVELRHVFGFDHRCVWPNGGVHWIHGVGEVLTGEANEVVGAVGVALDIDERVRLLEIEHIASERARFLERTNRVLVDSLDLGVVVDRITSAAIHELADWCSLVVTIDQPGDAPLVAVAHSEPAMVVWAKRLQKQYPYDATAASGIANVVRTGITEYVPVIDAGVLDAVVVDPELRQIIETLDLRSSIIVPIVGGLGTLGALQLVRTSTRPTFTQADVGLATELAGPIGAALNNTILFGRQQAAQHALEGLQRLTAQLADLSTVADIATAVVQSGAGLVHANKALLYLAEPSGSFHLAAQIGYDPAEMSAWRVLAASDSAPIADAVRDRSPIVLCTRHEIDARYPYMSHSAVDDAAIVTLPLLLRGRVIGGLFVAWGNSHAVTDTEMTLLRNVASRCAGALERARLYERQRTIALTLQRSLLPSHLASPDWFHAEGHYWPGEEGTEVGGDFYDLFAVGDDRWALTIGDVCGKGVEAAALTAVARHTARSSARHADSPSDVLLRIHEALQTYDGTNFCTVCFALLERSGDTITVHVALGGHPHPLLRRHNGQVERLGRTGTLLGLFPPDTLTTRTRLFPGDVLVLYTDGVTDAPGELAVTDEEFADTISAAGPNPTAIASAISHLLNTRRPGGINDDTALLIVEISQSGSVPTAPDRQQVDEEPSTCNAKESA